MEDRAHDAICDGELLKLGGGEYTHNQLRAQNKMESEVMTVRLTEDSKSRNRPAKRGHWAWRKKTIQLSCMCRTISEVRSVEASYLCAGCNQTIICDGLEERDLLEDRGRTRDELKAAGGY